MKALYNANKSVRIVQRGTKFFVQQPNGSKATRETDSWSDVGPAKATLEEARAHLGEAA